MGSCLTVDPYKRQSSTSNKVPRNSVNHRIIAVIWLIIVMIKHHSFKKGCSLVASRPAYAKDQSYISYSSIANRHLAWLDIPYNIFLTVE